MNYDMTISEKIKFLISNIKKGYDIVSKDFRFKGTETSWSFTECSINESGDVTEFKACALSCAEIGFNEMSLEDVIRIVKTNEFSGDIPHTFGVYIPHSIILKSLPDSIQNEFLDQEERVGWFKIDGGQEWSASIRGLIYYLNDDLHIHISTVIKMLENIAENLETAPAI